MNTSSPNPEAVPNELIPTTVTPRAGWLGNAATWPLRRLLERLLQRVSAGSIVVELPGGQRAEARGAAAGPHALIKLHRWRVMQRLALAGDIGLAESYRDGDWSTPDLTAVLLFGSLNEAGWDGALEASWPVRLATRLFHLARSNTRRGSRQNISFHYDMGNDFYAQWLDPDMIYSSAGTKSAGTLDEHGSAAAEQSLEDAQSAKIDRIIELLDIQGRSEVLEIGCGWGALAAALARRKGARVTGLTLSTEQLAHAKAQVDAGGLQSLVDLRLQDYRDVTGDYDRIVSIEMLEAVGERYWPTYFQTLHDRLRLNGKAVVQVITIADDYFEHYSSNADFIQRFIFPGGMLPSVSVMREQASRAGLKMETAESFGPSYAATLVEWRRRFQSAWPRIEALGFDARFRRLWEYYLCYCEAGFLTQRVDVGLYVFTHA